jgi:GNAT superfamily N-acetyltransferase
MRDQVETVVIPWMREASSRFFDRLLGGLLDDGVFHTWLHRPGSEYGLDRLMLALHHQEIVGGWVAGPGMDMLKARSRDMMMLLRSGNRGIQTELARRMAALKVDLGPMGADEFYLRALGVVAPWRGRGVGRQLLAECARQGQAAGYGRLRLDVYDDNVAALRLYESEGFTICARASSDALGCAVLAMSRAI